MNMLSCQGFRDCEKVQNGYVCHVGDSNYLFVKCTTLLISSNEGFNPNEVLKNFRFIYEQNEKRIEEPKFQPTFTLKYNSVSGNAFECDISRPTSLPLVTNKEHPVKIELHFESDVDLENAQLSIKSDHENYHQAIVCNLF